MLAGCFVQLLKRERYALGSNIEAFVRMSTDSDLKVGARSLGTLLYVSRDSTEFHRGMYMPLSATTQLSLTRAGNCGHLWTKFSADSMCSGSTAICGARPRGSTAVRNSLQRDAMFPWHMDM